MSVAMTTPPRLITAEEFLAIPDDGVDRWLLDGVVRESGMTLRNLERAGIAANVVVALRSWLATQGRPRGRVVVGDCGFRIGRDPDRLVGPDVGFATAELRARTAPGAAYFDGPPALAVEILSPSDSIRDIAEKVESYFRAGAVVWEVDPHFRTVRVHRPGQLPESFNVAQEIDAGADLPGLRVAVAAIFED